MHPGYFLTTVTWIPYSEKKPHNVGIMIDSETKLEHLNSNSVVYLPFDLHMLFNPLDPK